MPAYEFELCHQATGEVVARLTVPLPVEDRDSLTLRRSALPRSLCICPVTPSAGQQQATNVLNSYQRAEQRIGNNSEFQRRIGHSADQVKAAWGNEA